MVPFLRVETAVLAVHSGIPTCLGALYLCGDQIRSLLWCCWRALPSPAAASPLNVNGSCTARSPCTLGCSLGTHRSSVLGHISSKRNIYSQQYIFSCDVPKGKGQICALLTHSLRVSLPLPWLLLHTMTFKFWFGFVVLLRSCLLGCACHRKKKTNNMKGVVPYQPHEWKLLLPSQKTQGMR